MMVGDDDGQCWNSRQLLVVDVGVAVAVSVEVLCETLFVSCNFTKTLFISL